MTTEAHARKTDSDTSHAAAASLRTTNLEALVLDTLRKLPNGAISFELADLLDLSLVAVSLRLRPLANKGLVVDSGDRRVGASGRKQIVWKAA
jgi:hypothetical protein